MRIFFQSLTHFRKAFSVYLVLVRKLNNFKHAKFIPFAIKQILLEQPLILLMPLELCGHGGNKRGDAIQVLTSLEVYIQFVLTKNPVY